MPAPCRLPKFSKAARGRPAEQSRASAALMEVHRSRLLATERYFRRPRAPGRRNMEGVTVVEHPLVQHKLTLIRNKDISTKSFRELIGEIGMLLCYEVTRDLPLTMMDIET